MDYVTAEGGSQLRARSVPLVTMIISALVQSCHDAAGRDVSAWVWACEGAELYRQVFRQAATSAWHVLRYIEQSVIRKCIFGVYRQ